MQIRDRYAPSPTGLQHIGGVRTALFNYLFAHSKEAHESRDAAFILRLEDTDRTRFDAAFVQNLYDTFAWLGIHWDEGPDVGGQYAPYIQSERLELYKRYILELLDADKAYYCFCSPERLETIRLEREASRSGETGYDRHCRSIPKEEAAARVASGQPCVIRLKIPLDGITGFYDRLLGHIEWKNRDVNPDPVLLKSDGFPTYHLANVVDDHLMGITHVLRAQEWLSSTPLHVIIYAGFGWTPPEFCHLPMVMGQDGKKLSKRHGATGVDEFRRQGYLGEALVNYVAFLGASYEEGKDVYTLAELAACFSLDKLNKAPAVFDYKKLEWYNAAYIRVKTNEELAQLALPFAVEAGIFEKVGKERKQGSAGIEPDAEQKRIFVEAMSLVKERVSFLTEIPAKVAYLFSEPPLPDASEFFPKKADIHAFSKTITLLTMGKDLVSRMAAMTDADAEAFIKTEAEKAGVKLGDLMMPLRVAVTGARVSPPLFGSLRLLGAEASALRVEKALAKLTAEPV
ncbi:MAG: glutamate--tRNA ligase [Treponema sp.]|jgi:glutamyl-tRNA synthetase|nr:glutamate--tRNA ligase [Treponema sp.]